MWTRLERQLASEVIQRADVIPIDVDPRKHGGLELQAQVPNGLSLAVNSGGTACHRDWFGADTSKGRHNDEHRTTQAQLGTPTRTLVMVCEVSRSRIALDTGRRSALTVGRR